MIYVLLTFCMFILITAWINQVRNERLRVQNKELIALNKCLLNGWNEVDYKFMLNCDPNFVIDLKKQQIEDFMKYNIQVN